MFRVSSWLILSFESPVIQVRVGEGKKEKIFNVHQSLITSRSKFFECATKENWRQKEGVIEIVLPCDDPAVFRLYLHLIYTNRLATKGHGEWDRANWIICPSRKATGPELPKTSLLMGCIQCLMRICSAKTGRVWIWLRQHRSAVRTLCIIRGHR